MIMKSNSVIILIVIVISIICCFFAACGLGVAVYWISSQSGDFDFGPSLQTGQTAPDFQLDTIDGEKVVLSDYRGKPVMVNFWALWCNPCIQEMGVIQERYQQHYPDLVVLAIEENGKGVSLRDYLAESNIGFLVLAGSESVARKYSIRAYPTSFFIDEHGVIQSIVVGSLSGSSLDVELEKIGVGDHD